MEMKRRVVITGFGGVSALGANVDAAWRAAATGECGVCLSEVASPDASAPGVKTLMARVNAVGDSKRSGSVRGLKIVDRFAAFALAATEEALIMAQLLEEEQLLAGAQIIYGTGCFGMESIERGYVDLFVHGNEKVHPMTVPNTMPSCAVSALSIAFGVKGESYSVSSACSSSAYAIMKGATAIRGGETRLAIVGGAEAPLTYGHLVAWRCLGALADSKCAPFAKGRCGTALGEGAATIILEDAVHAAARGAPIYGEILAGMATSDASHITKPNIQGVLAALEGVYQRAGVSRAEPALISAHGTGTRLNDACEAEALIQFYGNELWAHVVTATKSLHGHMLGAGGAYEVLIGLKGVLSGLAPPTAGVASDELDFELPLALSMPTRIKGDLLVSNAFAFGGSNVVLLIRGGPLQS